MFGASIIKIAAAIALFILAWYILGNRNFAGMFIFWWCMEIFNDLNIKKGGSKDEQEK